MLKTIILWMLILSATAARAQIRIWADTDERAPSVTLTPYLPATGGKHVAVIICPGGSYHWLDRQAEGIDVAHWLQSQGIAAFVLSYRTVGIIPFITHSRLLFRGVRHPDMFRDVQRAIQLVRERAQTWNIATNSVGVMGFSAGGHLAMAAAEFAATDFLAPIGIHANVSLRPNFVAALYPVVTLSDKRFVHKRSRKGLLGEWGKNNRQMRDSLSLERHVPSDCPPAFIACCADDPVVHPANAALLDSALTARHINHRYIRFNTGGHGFGASATRGTEECRRWKEMFLSWLQEILSRQAQHDLSTRDTTQHSNE